MIAPRQVISLTPGADVSCFNPYLSRTPLASSMTEIPDSIYSKKNTNQKRKRFEDPYSLLQSFYPDALLEPTEEEIDFDYTKWASKLNDLLHSSKFSRKVIRGPKTEQTSGTKQIVELVDLPPELDLYTKVKRKRDDTFILNMINSCYSKKDE